MFGISLAQLMLKRQERQIIDLEFARKLWDVYEHDRVLMRTMKDICVVGVECMQRVLNRANLALGCTDCLETYPKNLSGSIKFLDCFEGKPVTRAMISEMGERPDTWFKDLGKIGGWFRGYAETSENLTEVIFDVHKKLDVKKQVNDAWGRVQSALAGVRGDEGVTVGDATRTLSGALRASHFLAGAKLGPDQLDAIIFILEREYDGRLGHQRKLVRRGLKASNPNPGSENVLPDVYRYTGEWFGKWQRKTVADGVYSGDKEALENPEAQFEKQRARRGLYRLDELPGGRAELNQGRPIPEWIRPHVRLASHCEKDRAKTSAWVNAGIYKWKQMEWDRLWLLAQLYGLPPGATISGTTTDHVFTIYEVLTRCEEVAASSSDRSTYMAELAGRIQRYLPYLFLIPVIQMGAQMHHAICEMATALSLNDFISYHVGYYSSLLPAPGADPKARLDTQRGKMFVPDENLDRQIRRVMENCEKKVSNLYGVGAGHWEEDPTGLAAFVVDPSKPEEVKKHRDLALLDPTTAARFERIPVNITREVVMNWASEIDGIARA